MEKNEYDDLSERLIRIEEACKYMKEGMDKITRCTENTFIDLTETKVRISKVETKITTTIGIVGFLFTVLMGIIYYVK